MQTKVLLDLVEKKVQKVLQDQKDKKEERFLTQENRV